MTHRRFARAAAGLAAFWSAACGSPFERALAPLATETLTPGVGLGPVRLGKTPFAAFLKVYGPGVTTVIQSDDAAYEMTYAGGELSVLFIVDGECKTQSAGKRLESGGLIEQLFTRAPACRDITAASVSVRLAKGGSRGWYRGKTDKGVALGDPVTAASAHGATRNAPGVLVAGMRQSEPTERIEYVSGMYLFHSLPKASGDTLVIEKLTIFRPE